MFRFTIRDILWAMLVCGLAITNLLSYWDTRKSREAEKVLRSRALSLEAVLRAEDYDVYWSGTSAFGYTEKSTGGPTLSLEPGVDKYSKPLDLEYRAPPLALMVEGDVANRMLG